MNIDVPPALRLKTSTVGAVCFPVTPGPPAFPVGWVTPCDCKRRGPKFSPTDTSLWPCSSLICPLPFTYLPGPFRDGGSHGDDRQSISGPSTLLSLLGPLRSRCLCGACLDVSSAPDEVQTVALSPELSSSLGHLVIAALRTPYG